MFLTLRRTCLQLQLRYKMVFILICIFSIISLFSWRNARNAEKCFMDKYFGEFEKYRLEDILQSKRKPTLGKSIFFHETSCSSSAHIQLNARQACAIESAALMNPNYDVFVLFATPTIFISNSSISSSSSSASNHDLFIKALLSYKNIQFRNVNLWTYAADTPMYEWLKNGELFKSKYVLSHVSDFLRYLTLWRWGGIYLDMDVVVQKSFEKVPLNFAGAESTIVIAAGVLSFDHNAFGHEIADLCLRNFQMTFNGNNWGNNGPGVITRVLQEICKTKSTLLMTKERCFGFQVYPQEAFYAIKWTNWEKFFSHQHLNEVMNKTKNSFVIHVWNKHSNVKNIKVGSNVAYAKIAEEYCPRVYKSCGDYF